MTEQEFSIARKSRVPIILGALKNRSMTVNELIDYLLANYYGDIDEEFNLILTTLELLTLADRIRIDRVVAVPDKNLMAEVYIMAR